MKKKVVYFGSYHLEYSRNLLTKKAFDDLGWRVLDCHDDTGNYRHYFRLVRKFLKFPKDFDLIFVGVLGHYDMPLAWILAKIFGKKVIFDCFFSLYDTYINDRANVQSDSLRAKRFFFYDWLSIRLADKVILDTQENIDYLVKKYKAKKSKFYELPVTADPDIFKFKPPKKHEIFSVGFYGSFMPLHGVDLIVDAVKILKNDNIKFYLSGEGPGVESIKNKIKKLSLKEVVDVDNRKVPYSHLPLFLKKLDLFLAGPFGESAKAKRVLTAKTVEALAAGVPTVVSKNSATERLLRDYGGEILWVKKNTAYELASIIGKAKAGSAKRNTNMVRKDYFTKSRLGFGSFSKKINAIITSN